MAVYNDRDRARKKDRELSLSACWYPLCFYIPRIPALTNPFNTSAFYHGP